MVNRKPFPQPSYHPQWISIRKEMHTIDVATVHRGKVTQTLQCLSMGGGRGKKRKKEKEKEKRSYRLR